MGYVENKRIYIFWKWRKTLKHLYLKPCGMQLLIGMGWKIEKNGWNAAVLWLIDSQFHFFEYGSSKDEQA